MVLINDITKEDTHNKYAGGSNNRSILKGGISVPEELAVENGDKF
jgi:hypothetical protein